MKLPYYNKLWLSDLIEFNPMYDADYTIDHEGRGTNDRDETATLTGRNKFDGDVTIDVHSERDENLLDKYSDTPQGALNGVIDTDWLTNARQDENHFETDSDEHTVTDNTTLINTKNVVDSGIVTTDEYLRHVVGKFPGKSYSRLLDEYRKTFINIDEKFIHEFDDLFMLIY